MFSILFWIVMLNLSVVCLVHTVHGVGFNCFNCSHVKDAGACKNFDMCNDGNRCFKEVVELEDGSADYNWGCASKQLCVLESNISNRRKRLGIEKCFECCDGNFCNFGACTRDYCSSVTCANGATCTNTALGASCVCVAGYTGTLCETDINECSTNPCKNGATCRDMIGSYRCTCVAGFTGNNCETNIEECLSQPCQNGALCIDQVNSYTCSCKPGYTGIYCQQEIDECQSSPCQYNSTCIDHVAKYTCNCVPGTTGDNCEINIDDCANITCQNSGQCQDRLGDFYCACPQGFTGTYCEISLGRVCYQCDDASDVANCTTQVICGKQEECFMEHELLSPGVFNFNLGCVPTQMCAYVQNLPQAGKRHVDTLVLTRRNNPPIQLCYECCDTNNCNHHACVDSRG